MFAGAFQNKTVWLSGHTGFKGAWLARWLLKLGANVHGFSLAPNTQPSVFEQLRLKEKVAHEIGDIRDFDSVKQSIARANPDFIFHLAAQPLVRFSYEHPLETYSTNVMGTAHVLEAARSLKKTCAAVFITTDKCYENCEVDHAYDETDPLGGHDPYSSSKGAAEIVIAAYRRSFFGNHPVRIASARAGNVIGGGDWASDRIVPDCIRSLQRGEPIPVRNPAATRPWQHVLEPLSGYLWLAAALVRPELVGADVAALSTAFNFGPDKKANRNVGDLVTEVLKHWPGRWEDKSNPAAPHEARLLMLSTARAEKTLQWRPAWDFESAVARTVEWYRSVHEQGPASAEGVAAVQIAEYEQAAAAMRIAWIN
jgi:CDP-glucose 4,6-dehydratase